MNGIMVPLLAARMSKGRGKAEVTARTRLKEFLVDRLQGIQDLLWLGQKKNSQGELQSIQATLDKIQHHNAGTNGFTEGLNNLMAHLAMFSVLVLAIPMVAAGVVKGVWLAALTLGVLSSFEALQGLANAFIQYETSLEASRRLHILAESGTPEFATGQLKTSLPTTTPAELAFNNVSFSYDEENITLDDISFTIPPGSKTAIVGPTGSGKSTLANLILGLWHPEKGMVTAGGENIRELEKESYRSRFGVVAQDSYIFNRSLRENLLLAKPDATDHELVEAMEKAGMGPFAANLDLEPGNLGMRLSGGERQLLAVARALLKKPSIWIFDEPTANMDVNTERNTLNTIWSVTRQNTLILITHRMVDMDRMDQIIVMDKGRIAEKGTHEQLLSQHQIYAKMYEQQNQVIRE
jgi:ATP-binding cassette, subfamily C, bacterial CydC